MGEGHTCGTGEIALWIKRFLNKCESLRLPPQQPCEAEHGLPYLLYQRWSRGGKGAADRWVLGACWRQPEQKPGFRFCVRYCLKGKRWEDRARCLLSSSGLYMARAHMHTHTRARAHARMQSSYCDLENVECSMWNHSYRPFLYSSLNSSFPEVCICHSETLHHDCSPQVYGMRH